MSQDKEEQVESKLSQDEVNDIPLWEIQRDECKAKGDEAFRSKDYTAAIRHYSAAIDFDDAHILLYSNRSAAYLAQHEKSKALYDAQKCLELDPTFVKGYTRYAAALKSLGRHRDALKQYQKALEFDPRNKIALDGAESIRDIIQKQLDEQKELEKSAMAQQNARKCNAAEDKPSDESQVLTDDKDNNDKPLSNDDPEKEHDDLDDFFDEVEEVVSKPNKKPLDQFQEAVTSNAPSKLKETLSDLGTSAQQIDRLLASNYEWKNLNPYYVLAISDPENTQWEMVQKRYKALSLLVHPDKQLSNTERAREAFEQVRFAIKLLEDENKRKHVIDLIAVGRKQAKKDWTKEHSTKKMDPNSKEYQEHEQKCIMKLFAEIEMKRRDVERRKREYEQRTQQQEDDAINKEKDEREFDKSWKDNKRVDKRVGDWRSFQNKKSRR